MNEHQWLTSAATLRAEIPGLTEEEIDKVVNAALSSMMHQLYLTKFRRERDER
jgi:hypothetical protein